MANTLELSDLTTDFSDFVVQFNNWLSQKEVWKGTLTTQTSQTLVELASALGAFSTGRIYRVYEDAYAETAQSDNAIRAIVQMQGLRMARYLPAGLAITLTSPFNVSLPPLTQFGVGGFQFFNRTQFNLLAGTPLIATVFEGSIKSIATNGLGTDLQSFVSDEDGFIVSDLDMQIAINGIIIPKAFGGLWNYKGLPAYSDLTMADGRALIQFGNAVFGSVPGVNDTVSITYPITKGGAGNNLALTNDAISVSGFPTIVGIVNANPTGGANDKPIVAYKNVASGSFGTYLSAVTKSQYQATIISYPGIIDAYTQAQREIDPSQLKWMNVIRVSGLTSSPWTQQQKADFCAYQQTVCMYAPYFVWVDAKAVPRDVNVEVYVFNTATLSEIQQAVTNAIVALFSPQPGLLMTNHYQSDLTRVCFNAAPGMISYVIINSPSGSMIVTAPESPLATYSFIPGGGTLGELVYAYSVSTVLVNGEVGPASTWCFPQIIGPTATYAIGLAWPAVTDASQYKVWGRISGGTAMGLLATLPANVLSFIDDGSIVPVPPPPATLADVPIRHNSLNSLTVTVEFAERQQRMDGTPHPQRKFNG